MDLKLRFALAFSTISLILVSAFSFVVYQQVEQRVLASARDALSEHVSHEINHLHMYKAHEDTHANTLTNKDIFQRTWKDTVLVKDSFPASAPNLNPEMMVFPKDEMLVQKTSEKIDGSTYDIIAYHDLHATKLYLNTLAKVLALGCMFALILILPLSWGLSKTLLRPFKDLAAQTQRLDVKQLSFRFPEVKKQDEYGTLVRSFNSLLDRLELSFRQIYRFASSASHELRTPLTVIRGEAELMLRRPRENAEYKNGFINVLNHAETLERITSRLLFLADIERMEQEGKTTLIQVKQTITEIVSTVKKVHHDKTRNISVTGSPITFLGHPELFISIVSNLIENAVKYSRNQVRVSFEKNGSSLTLRVEDDGRGIEQDQREKVFEPFFRSQDVKDTVGHGLGLSIVKACIDASRGEIKLGKSALLGLLVEVQLPETV